MKKNYLKIAFASVLLACTGIATELSAQCVPPTVIASSATASTICFGQSTNLNASAYGTQFDFAGFYAPANWTFTAGPGGSDNTASAPASISITSGNSGSAGYTTLDRGVLSATQTATITFSWSYSTTDGPNYDYPRYLINGVATAIPGYSTGGSTTQSGTATITVPAGQTFGLSMYTVDGIFGAATTIFSNFTGTYHGGDINWYTVPTGGTSIGTSVSGVDFSAIPTTSGVFDYYAEASTSISCVSASRTLVSVTVNALPSVTASATSSSFCIGGSTTLTGGGATSYVWDNGVTDGVSFNPISSVLYTVTGTDGNSCTNTATVLVTVNQLPIVTASASLSTICSGSMENLTGGGATSYVWDNGVTDGVDFAATSSTTYNVTGTDANGCVNTASVSVTVNSLPTVTANASAITICSGDAETLTGGGATSYVWDNSVTDGVAFNPTSTITYNVTGTDGNGCNNTASVTVNVNQLPVISSSNASSASICAGATSDLSATSAGNAINWWTASTGGTLLTTVASGTNYSVTPSTTTTYYAEAVSPGAASSILNGTTAANGSNGQYTLGYTFTPSSTITVTGVRRYFGTKISIWDNTGNLILTQACSGTDGVWSTTPCTSTVLNAGSTYYIGAWTNGGSYYWDFPTYPYILAAGTIGNGQYSTSDSWPSITDPGMFYVDLEFAESTGCTSSPRTAVTVTVNQLPTVTANASATTICLGDAETLTGSGASTYVWDNSVTDGVAFNPTSTLTYNVTGTDGNGCVNTASVSVSVNSLPTVSANASAATICAGDAETLTGGGAVSYVWDNGVTDGVTIYPTTSVTYNVTGTDGNGCMNTASVSVNVNALPTVTANASSTAVCLGSSTTLTGGGAVSYVWDNGVTDGVAIIPTADLTYNVTGTDGNGCMNTASVLVTINALPTVTANASSLAICAGDAETLTGGGAVSYVWDNSVSDGVAFNPTLDTTYVVTGTDANGCVNTASVTVTINPLPVVTYTESTIMSCVNWAAFTLSAGSPVNGVYSGTGVTGSDFDPAAAGVGTYSVTYSYTDGNGCTASASSSLMVDACTGVNSVNANETVVAYPNPSSGVFNIDLNKTSLVIVYDQLGQVVFQKEMNSGKNEIDLTNLANGLYSLKVGAQSIRLIKQ